MSLHRQIASGCIGQSVPADLFAGDDVLRCNPVVALAMVAFPSRR